MFDGHALVDRLDDEVAIGERRVLGGRRQVSVRQDFPRLRQNGGGFFFSVARSVLRPRAATAGSGIDESELKPRLQAADGDAASIVPAPTISTLVTERSADPAEVEALCSALLSQPKMKAQQSAFDFGRLNRMSEQRCPRGPGVLAQRTQLRLPPPP